MKRRGFSLVELIVVALVILILVALLVPLVRSSREAGRLVRCASNLRQIGTTLTLYAHTADYYPEATAEAYGATKGLHTVLDLREPAVWVCPSHGAGGPSVRSYWYVGGPIRLAEVWCPTPMLGDTEPRHTGRFQVWWSDFRVSLETDDLAP